MDLGTRLVTETENEAELSKVGEDLTILALSIVEFARRTFSSHEEFLDAALGEELTRETADAALKGYLRRSGLPGDVRIKWDANLNVGGRVVSTRAKGKRAKRAGGGRQFTLMVFDPSTRKPTSESSGGGTSSESGKEDSEEADSESGSDGSKELLGEEETDAELFGRAFGHECCDCGGFGWGGGSRIGASSSILRKNGIISFADHELGTHVVRSFNDAHQPWHSEGRAEIGAKGSTVRSRSFLKTEEGLASLNTAAAARIPLLFYPSILYLAAVAWKRLKDTEEVARVLCRWLPNLEVARRMAARATKHGRPFGGGQAYLEGAVEISRALSRADGSSLHRVLGVERATPPPISSQSLDNPNSPDLVVIDPRILYLGRVALTEYTPRILRASRLGAIVLPPFARHPWDYRKRLLRVAHANWLLEPPSLSLTLYRTPHLDLVTSIQPSSSSSSTTTTTTTKKPNPPSLPPPPKRSFALPKLAPKPSVSRVPRAPIAINTISFPPIHSASRKSWR